MVEPCVTRVSGPNWPKNRKALTVKLTAAVLNSLPEGDHTDHIIPGLTLRVGKKRRTWVLRYLANGTRHKPTIGYYVPNAPEGSESLGLADARNMARDMLARVEAGVAAQPEEAKVVHPKDAMTLADVIDGYEKFRTAKAKGNDPKWKRGMKTLPEAMRTIRHNLADYLKLPAKSFTKANLRTARDTVAARAPHMSDRFMSYLGPVMKWAAQEDHIETNFCPDVAKVGPGVVKRDRVLSDDELRRIWIACGQFNSPGAQTYGRLVRFLMVTAQRREEGSTLLSGEILDGRWKIAEDKNKSGRDHFLKLPKLALDQLDLGGPNDLCFEGTKKGRPLSGYSKLKSQLDKLSGVKKWRHHDLRRTASTHLQDTGTPPHVVDAILNHAIQGVGAHYMHGPMNDLKAAALAEWAAHLEKIFKAKTVVKMHA